MSDIKKPLPSYGLQVDKFRTEQGLIVCTGSHAWDKAKSKLWINSTPKIVLPFGEEPSQFNWSARNREVMIFSDGKPETYQRLIDLSKCLLQSGAIWVLWAIKGYPLTKIEPSRNEVVL